MMQHSNIVILGGGESGTGAALLAKQQGLSVFLSDRGQLSVANREELQLAGVELEEGGHTEARVLAADVLVKSPGIPDTAELVQKALKQGIEVVSEIEFASWYCTKPVVAITGTNGKTTTTSLIGHILRSAGLRVALGGNLGTSFARLLLNDALYEVYVLEISSFQLDGIQRFCPDIALLLNITPDHLDRYNYQMEQYVASKFRIGMNQRTNQHFLYCTGDSWTLRGLESFAGKAARLGIDLPVSLEARISVQGGTLDLSQSVLRGRHNILNAAFAAEAARLYGLSREQIQHGLNTFVNAPHRLERVDEQGWVLYINDSKATNVEAVYYALEAMERPTVWIAGGTDKGNDYEPLFPLVREKVKALVCIGVDNSKLHRDFDSILEGRVVDAATMSEAVDSARELSDAGDVVLLSPACASFDRFRNYEDRGNQFKDAVRSNNEVPCQ
jgi:UDP-N-acetylmuramoylalanine--D-glutamate ligase